MSDELSKTLLEFASVNLEAGDSSNACLILVDYQNEYVRGKLPLEGTDAALSEAKSILGDFRKANAPVIYVVHHAESGAALFNPETEMVEVANDLVPEKNEKVVVKSQPNAFAGTDLEDVVRATGRDQLVVIGFMTHMCVSSTVRAASELGFQSTVIAAACATRNLPSPTKANTEVQARDVQDSALAALADRFAKVVPQL